MNYTEAVDFLEHSFKSFQKEGRSAYHEGLETISDFCKRLDNPQRNYYTIHIAGTNGKGSVAHIIASVLQSAGYCTGLYTSPHLYSFRERIRVDGEQISEKAVTEFVNRWGNEMVEAGLSFFEMTTAMAFSYFSDSNIEVAVIETGLGGRLDATNILCPIVSVITNVGRDHTDILGETLQQIATEKAGIIKRSVPVVVGESREQTNSIFETVATERQAPLFFADQIYECLERDVNANGQRFLLQRIANKRSQYIDLDLAGEYQAQNIITAMTVFDVLKHSTPINISTRALNEGTRSAAADTGLRYRWQIVGTEPLVVFDCGHNAHSFKRITAQIKNTPHEKLYAVLGFSADKRIDKILSLLPQSGHYIFTQASSHRAMPAGDIVRMAEQHGLSCSIAQSPSEAYDLVTKIAHKEDMVFVGGSFYMLGEINRF